MITLESLLNNESSNINESINLEDYSFELSNYTMECSDIMSEINTLEAASIVCEGNAGDFINKIIEKIKMFCNKIKEIIKNIIRKLSRFIKSTFAKIKGEKVPNWYYVDILEKSGIRVGSINKIQTVCNNISDIEKDFHELSSSAKDILDKFNEQRKDYEDQNRDDFVLTLQGFGSYQPLGFFYGLDIDISEKVDDISALKILDVVSNEDAFNRLEKIVNEFEALNNNIAKASYDHLVKRISENDESDKKFIAPMSEKLFEVQCELYKFSSKLTNVYRLWANINRLISKPKNVDLFIYNVVNPEDKNENKLMLFFRTFFDCDIGSFIRDITDIDIGSPEFEQKMYDEYIAPRIKDISKYEVARALKALNTSKELCEALGGDNNVEIIKTFLSKVK